MWHVILSGAKDPCLAERGGFFASLSMTLPMLIEKIHHRVPANEPGMSVSKGERNMSGNRGCIFNSLLFLIIVFVPLLGHIIATIMVFEDDHSFAGTILWLAMIWLVPFLGIFLYLVFGQRRRRVMFGQPSYQQHQPYQ